MSLRHLYRDINELGIYPDLYFSLYMIGKRGGKGDDISLSMNEKKYTNKYYGDVIWPCKIVEGIAVAVFKYKGDSNRILVMFTKMGKMVVKYHEQEYVIEFKKDTFTWILTHNSRRYKIKTIDIDIISVELAFHIIRRRNDITGPKALVSMIKKQIEDK